MRLKRKWVVSLVFLFTCSILFPLEYTFARDLRLHQTVTRDNFIPSVKGNHQLNQIPLQNQRLSQTLHSTGANVHNSGESVIGADNRTQVTNTNQWPNSAIVQIEFKQENKKYICSGFLIDEKTVATAAHCVFGNGKWSTDMKITPGRNGSKKPFGTFRGIKSYAAEEWLLSESPDADYGAIILDGTPGRATGTIGITAKHTVGDKETLRGYPGDKTVATMWTHDDQIRKESVFRLFYQNDSYGGQSGSPVYNTKDKDCGTCAISIHAYGVGEDSEQKNNSGVAITTKIVSRYNQWRQDK